ncbi:MULTISPECIES: DNA repair exonuclease [unclassified Bosea (in: a-proteobacteria)]|uniref:metallophosphoesterase family protein n=1 Tax=unclassified Bosea (in: a-proteobacteria) TaxID=2653178 RepID=UPI000F763560|nr:MULTISPECIES: DNA repair exonuclease [unclassified Bosea (in: a-proteobacteria)]AZO81942.1 DNA repair exonuclease [Bosea sp. Tri-49]RXT16743.1 DNA repair exonuclease [Bosea sp. Tri-39]RXT42336.1 DNA repair exonuclease [Bosea sp. Tri-54]
MGARTAISSFRFVHCADLHIDAPLKSLALRNPELADLVANATRKAFVATVDLCLDEKVDALLISGDLYDGDQTSMKTAGFIAAQLRRLHDAGILTFGIRGNHDAESRITKELVFPESVTFFKGSAGAVLLPSQPGRRDIVVHGISFPRPHAPESLLPKFKPPVDGAINIGLLHTSLAGAEGHDRYAPCSVTELAAAGFEYWALGHVHKRQVYLDKPAIVMPGIPQGRDINESGPKSVSLVTISDDGAIQIQEHRTSTAQFERVSIDLSGVDDWSDAIRAVGRKLATERDATVSDHLIARVMLTGATPLTWRLRRDTELLLAEAEQQAAIVGNTWIEKVSSDCAASHGAALNAAGAVAELSQLITEDVLKSDSYRLQASEIVSELRGALPRELHRMFGEDKASFEKLVGQLSNDGALDVIAHLHGADQEPRV